MTLVLREPNSLGIPGCRVTPTTLTLSARMPLTEWARAGELLGGIARASLWWVADWLLQGADLYGEKAAQYVAVTGYAEHTLLNLCWVAKAVPASRRREDLSFAHHEAVARLGAEAQVTWLERAAGGDVLPAGDRAPWSTKRLRKEMRAMKDAACDGTTHHLPREQWSCGHRDQPESDGARSPDYISHAPWPGPPPHCPTCRCRL